MNTMDIKSLLLKGLSSVKPITGCRRLHFGKSCFVIKFQVRGKYLTIMQIRKVRRKHPSSRQGIYRRFHIFKHKIKQCPRNRTRSQYFEAGVDKAGFKNSPYDKLLSQTFLKTNGATQDKEVQTTCINTKQHKEVQTTYINTKPETKCCATETANISFKTSAQQTIATLRYNLSGSVMKPVTIIPPLLHPTVYSTSTPTQIEFDTIATGTQCKSRTLSGGTQTDEISVKTSSTQVWYNFVNDSNKKPSQNSCSNSKSFEQDAVIYMLNEIGELVLNQNHIIRNNTTMLNQITEMAVLSKMVKSGHSWRKRARAIPPRRTKCIRTRRALAVENLSVDCLENSSKSTQTVELHEPRTFSQYSQTTINLVKPRKLSFLKKQK